jgi:hypothetical protein
LDDVRRNPAPELRRRKNADADNENSAAPELIDCGAADEQNAPKGKG